MTGLELLKAPEATAGKIADIISALCEALGWNDDPRRIQGFVKRVAHVDRIEWLNMAQCEKVIEGLKAILARQRRKEAEL